MFVTCQTTNKPPPTNNLPLSSPCSQPQPAAAAQQAELGSSAVAGVGSLACVFKPQLCHIDIIMTSYVISFFAIFSDYSSLLNTDLVVEIDIGFNWLQHTTLNTQIYTLKHTMKKSVEYWFCDLLHSH